MLILIFAACVLGRLYFYLQLVNSGVCTHICSLCITACVLMFAACVFVSAAVAASLRVGVTCTSSWHPLPTTPLQLGKCSMLAHAFFPTYKEYFISVTATASPLEKELTVHTFHCTSLEFSKPFSYVLAVFKAAAIMILLASSRGCLGCGNFDFLASIVKYFICFLHVHLWPSYQIFHQRLLY